MARVSASVLERVRSTIGAHGLLRPGEAVLCLISGGADSTLLAHALTALGHPLATVHCAHALRGGESIADALACRDLAAALGSEHHEIDAPVATGAGIEQRARALRRSAADGLAAGRPIATGHTLDDRVETVLYRLATSPGRQAFAALGPRDGDRIRPLIDLRSLEVRAALSAAGIAWRDDASNRDLRFARNRVRHGIVPQLRLLHPQAEANLLETARVLDEERAAVEAVASALFVRGAALDCALVAAAPPAIVRVALRKLVGSPVSRATIARVIALAAAGHASGRVPLGPAGELVRAGGRLALAAPASAIPAPSPLPVGATTTFGGRELVCAPGSGRLALDPLLADRLSVRGARHGDRLAGHRRSIARMLLEQQVPRADRPRYPVVLAGGVPVCLPGIACSTTVHRSPGLLVELR